MNFFQRLFQRKTGAGSRPTPLTDRDVRAIIQKLQATREDEVSCDEVDALIDQFAEMVARGEDPAALMPLVQHHLEMCSDCREELEALLRVLQAFPA
jgi:hypothetical protein